jgi:hypothetical protein
VAVIKQIAIENDEPVAVWDYDETQDFCSIFDVLFTSNGDAPHINHNAQDLHLLLAPSFVTFEDALQTLCLVASWLFY